MYINTFQMKYILIWRLVCEFWGFNSYNNSIRNQIFRAQVLHKLILGTPKTLNALQNLSHSILCFYIIDKKYVKINYKFYN